MGIRQLSVDAHTGPEVKMLNKNKAVIFLGIILLITAGGGIYYLLGRDARGAHVGNETPAHLLALIEERAERYHGLLYLTLEEVVAETKRTGKFPVILSYYLSPTWGEVRVRTIKIDGEPHIIEYLDYPFIALNRGYGTTDGVWLVNARDGTVLLRAGQGQVVLKEQWGRLVPADDILNHLGGEHPWSEFGILQPFGLSPCGNNLGFFLHSRRGGHFDRTIFVGFLDLQTNTPHFTGFGHAPIECGEWRPRWSPTGAYIYYAHPISRADDPMAPANIDVFGGFNVDNAVTGQRSFSFPSLEMLTLLFPEQVREAKEKFKAPDFGGYLSLESAILINSDFRPWFSNLKWSPGDNSLSFTTVAERAVSEGEYLEAHGRNTVKEEFGQVQWIINADGSGLQLKSVVRPKSR